MIKHKPVPFSLNTNSLIQRKKGLTFIALHVNSFVKRVERERERERERVDAEKYETYQFLIGGFKIEDLRVKRVLMFTEFINRV